MRKHPTPKPASKEYLDNAIKLLDTLSTWLAVSHIGGLVFVYNAILTDKLAFEGPVILLCCILIGGAVNAFSFKAIAAISFMQGEWPYSKSLPWFSLSASGFGLLCALAAPLFYPALAQ